MRFHNHLYMNQRARKSKNRIIHKLKKGTVIWNLYVLAFPAGKNNQLEIYPSAVLQHPVYQNKQPYIIGFAYGYEQALQLIKEITEEVYEQTGDCNIREYVVSQKKRRR